MVVLEVDGACKDGDAPRGHGAAWELEPKMVEVAEIA